MADIALIDQPDFYTVTNISKNVDYSWYSTYIYQAQDFYIEKRVGIDLMNELKLQKDTNTLTPDNIILISYMVKPIVWYTLYEVFPFFHARMEDIGITVNTSDKQTSIDLKHLVYLRGEMQNKADNYMYTLITYLEKNKALYPLYQPPCSTCGNCYCSCNTNRQIFNQGIIF